MFTTDSQILKNYGEEYRIWQGIPSIAVTRSGKQFVCFYSGGKKEQLGNYVLLTSGNDHDGFSTVAAAIPDESHRYYDATVWIDPLDRLWVIWAQFPDETVFATICENPDDDELVFGKEFAIGKDVMMNAPTVLSTGEWLFPIAVWRKGIQTLPRPVVNEEECGSWAYVTTDNGKTFPKRGRAIVPQSDYDEHLFLEQADGSVSVFVRTTYGIGTAKSFDGGKTWGEGKDSGIPSPTSRFYIGRTPSGKVLMINHHNFVGRNNLTALLSEDDGKTWSHTLLLDERKDVSYPSVAFCGDEIYITYDHDRGAFKNTLAEALACEREILTAKITEKDIVAGKLTEKGSYLKRVISKLTDYKGNEAHLFDKK